MCIRDSPSPLAGYASDNSAESLLSTSTSKPVNQHRRLRNAGILLQLDSRARQRESLAVGGGPWESRFDAKNTGKEAGRSVSTGRCPVGAKFDDCTRRRNDASCLFFRYANLPASFSTIYYFTTNMRSRHHQHSKPAADEGPVQLRPHSITLSWWRGGATVRHFGLRSVGRMFKSCSRQRCVTTLGKLFTPMCLCHQAV